MSDTKKSYAVCIYLDPDSPLSLSPDTPKTPKGAFYKLANFQWVSTCDEKPTVESEWTGVPDNPTIDRAEADSLSFWAVGNYDKDTVFTIAWRHDGDYAGSPIGDGETTVLPGKDGFYESVTPPGYPIKKREAWFFAKAPIQFQPGTAKYSFTVQVTPPRPSEKGYFFVDPEMETEGGD